MKNSKWVTGKLELIERLNSSSFGNPRFLVKVGSTVCRTAPNAMLGYGIQNHFGCNVKALVGNYYGKATVKFVETV